MVSTGEGQAEQVRELPVDAELVIMRLPISGGWRGRVARRAAPELAAVHWRPRAMRAAWTGPG